MATFPPQSGPDNLMADMLAKEQERRLATNTVAVKNELWASYIAASNDYQIALLEDLRHDKLLIQVDNRLFMEDTALVDDAAIAQITFSNCQGQPLCEVSLAGWGSHLVKWLASAKAELPISATIGDITVDRYLAEFTEQMKAKNLTAISGSSIVKGFLDHLLLRSDGRNLLSQILKTRGRSFMLQNGFVTGKVQMLIPEAAKAIGCNPTWTLWSNARRNTANQYHSLLAWYLAYCIVHDLPGLPPPAMPAKPKRKPKAKKGA